MKDVSERARRAVTLLVLITVLVAQGAAAENRDGDRGLRERFERAKRFVVTLLARISLPPG